MEYIGTLQGPTALPQNGTTDDGKWGARSGTPPEFWWWVVGWPTEFRCLWRWQAVPQTKISLKGLKSHLFRSTQLFFGYSTRRVPTDALVGDILFFFSSLSFVFWNLSKLVDCWVCTSFQLTGEEYPPQKSWQPTTMGFVPGKSRVAWGRSNWAVGVSPESGRWPPGGSTPDVLEWQGIDWSRKADVTDVPVWYMWDAWKGVFSWFRTSPFSKLPGFEKVSKTIEH